MQIKIIDGGKAFDWRKISADYAKFRDIYLQAFYDKRVLDIGIGTGVLPRNLYHYGAIAQLQTIKKIP